MSFLHVDREKCTNCGVCAEVCPAGVIEFRAGNFPLPGKMIEKGCIHCGHCVASCPSGSLTHRDLPLEQFHFPGQPGQVFGCL